MTEYFVDLTPLPGHPVPTLLHRFGQWLEEQEHGSVGWFSLRTDEVHPRLLPEEADQRRRDCSMFLKTPNGSVLVLVNTGSKTPPAIGFLGSEGDQFTVASSLEEFLFLLSDGETGVYDLDAADADGREELRRWLKQNKVKAPKAKPFDFVAWLDGDTGFAKSSPAKKAPKTTGILGLSPLLGQLVTLLGRRSDDVELADFVRQTLGRSVPGSIGGISEHKHVVARKQGIEMLFSADVLNERCPPVNKTANSYIPYLKGVWLYDKFPEPLPFGLKFGMSIAEARSVLGEPTDSSEEYGVSWERALDPSREISLHVDQKTEGFFVDRKLLDDVQMILRVDVARGLTSAGDPVDGVFVAWAIERRLLDETRLKAHRSLINAIRKRKQQGSTLFDEALSRGLWDVHLKDKPGLRDFVRGWFYNWDDVFINDDFISLFGKRRGPYGPIPALRDDDWDAVDQATPLLDERFAKWIGGRRTKGGQPVAKKKSPSGRSAAGKQKASKKTTGGNKTALKKTAKKKSTTKKSAKGRKRSTKTGKKSTSTQAKGSRRRGKQ